MEIVVTGRHLTVSDRFRSHIEDKLAKVPHLAPRVQRIDVLVSEETNRRQAKAGQRVEITCHAKGPIIRAEACLDDKYAALDAALDKLAERLRRAGDKRRVHRGRRVPESVAKATARSVPPPAVTAEVEDDTVDDAAPSRLGDLGESPIEVREKVHVSAPMSLAQALEEMELVGHDFYLYHDIETNRPSVIYRRRGWAYGVLQLESQGVAGDEAAAS